jgi:sialate O-acetylesterase
MLLNERTDMQVASVFTNHMVLQREKPIPVWGHARPATRVSVCLTGADPVETIAGADGRWLVKLPRRDAGGPFQLTVSGGGSEVRFEDVWIGEVWIASGQSNMQMTVSGCRDAALEIARADYPGIRMLTAARVAVVKRQDTLGSGSWKICSPENVGSFSAAAYYFARELHQKLGVAIGVMDSSWGGTPAEAWTSREGLQADPRLSYYIDKLDRFLGPDGQNEREAAEKARADYWANVVPKDPGNQGVENNWHAPGFDDAEWKGMCLPTGWQTAGQDFSGVLWFRRELDIPAEWAGKDLDLHIGACDKRDFTYFNGEFLGSLGMEDNPEAWHMPRVYTVPGHHVKAGRNVVSVRVFSNLYQGGMIGPAAEMWAAPVAAPPGIRLSLAGDWRFRVERNFGKIPPAPSTQFYGDGNANTPSVLFNGMIAPLIPYAIRGFIWYQGESNADRGATTAKRPAEYRFLFPALIRDWRREWGCLELPFYFVQLANFQAVRDMPEETNWGHLREAQRFTLEVVPKTGMAVTIDIGDAADIHPKNKQDVGLRLAACALAKDYGFPEYIGSSPLPAAVWAKEGWVTIRFGYAAAGLEARGEKVVGFALAGADRVFHWAEAVIEGPDRVEVACPAVPEPRWVRYAWADNPLCNLYGGTGLPASPFEMAIPGGAWLNEV